MVRFASLIAMLVIGIPAIWADSRDDKVAKCIKEMDSKDAATRKSAAEEVGKIAAVRASYGAPAIDPLLKLLKDKDADVRAAAAEALGKMDEAGKVVQPLTDLLKNDKSDKVKASAALGLGLVGAEAKASIKVLRETAQKARADKKNQLAQACNRAIENINGGRKK